MILAVLPFITILRRDIFLHGGIKKRDLLHMKINQNIEYIFLYLSLCRATTSTTSITHSNLTHSELTSITYLQRTVYKSSGVMYGE